MRSNVINQMVGNLPKNFGEFRFYKSSDIVWEGIGGKMQHQLHKYRNKQDSNQRVISWAFCNYSVNNKQNGPCIMKVEKDEHKRTENVHKKLS